LIYQDDDAARLRDALRFDGRRTIEGDRADALIKGIAAKLSESDPDFRLLPARRAALRVLLANLCEASVRDKPLAISMDRNYYVHAKRYRVPGESYAALRAVKEAMVGAGLIVVRPGMKDRITGKGFRTRLEPSEALKRALDGAIASGVEIVPHCREEGIVLKDAAKKPIDYAETAETRRLRSHLDRLNSLLADTEIVLADGKRVQPWGKKLYRVFNNGSFEQGGRFYRAEWQSLPKEERKGILIDGSPTVERDYSGMHVKMLYKNAADIDYRDDPYAVPGFEDERDAMKQVLLICVNAKSRAAAVRAILKDMQDEPEKYPEGFRVKKAVDAFLEKHAPIAQEFFNPSLGVRLQRMDAEIAEDVMSALVKQRVPVLPIHDSFIVKEEDEQTLLSAMVGAYRKHVGTEATIHDILAFFASEKTWSR
jgi:hypothetical protein